VSKFLRLLLSSAFGFGVWMERAERIFVIQEGGGGGGGAKRATFLNIDALKS